MSLLQANSMLVSFSISLFRGTRKDDRGTIAARSALNTTSNKGAFTKRVLEQHLRPLEVMSNSTYLWHRFMTLPYSDEGSRLLPIKNFDAYESGMRERITAFDAAADSFIENYEKYRDAELNDPANGGLFLPADYPVKSGLRAKFAIRVNWGPVPDKSHFIVNLADDKLDEMRASVDDRILEVQKSVRNDLYHRLAETLVHISTKMKSYQEGKSRLHQTTLTNLLEVCRVIPNLNVTEDPEIERLRVMALDAFGNSDIEELKDNEDLRISTATTADSILSAMGLNPATM